MIILKSEPKANDGGGGGGGGGGRRGGTLGLEEQTTSVGSLSGRGDNYSRSQGEVQSDKTSFLYC